VGEGIRTQPGISKLTAVTGQLLKTALETVYNGQCLCIIISDYCHKHLEKNKGFGCLRKMLTYFWQAHG
jgi:hypothetical protein